jgi:hypothetical protein
MRIVRSFTPWNWLEPADGEFRFDEFDLLFELAAKHDLKVWLDTPVGTHMACPEWLDRLHPDMRVEWCDGTIQHPKAGPAMPLGTMIHNYDHSAWRPYAERFVRAIVGRYKDHPNLLIWGTWDAINFAAAWADNREEPAYNDYTIDKYKRWLRERYSLEDLNRRLLRQYRTWDDVAPPRSNDAIVEMLLYRQFHYENMADHLGWLADLIDRMDGKHEQRSHGTIFPRQWDERCAGRIDGWGLSHHSANRLTSDDPYCVAKDCLGFQWSRAIGKEGRWWNEEIYGSFVGGVTPNERRTIPEESTAYLWLSLIEGAAGALYWQYRPEYMTFEAPGLSLASLDGEPTDRLHAIQDTIVDIERIAEHLPLRFPQADMAIAYSSESHDIFSFGDRGPNYMAELQGAYRTLWKHSIPRDIVTPGMSWSGYKLVYLPNLAVIDEPTADRIRAALAGDAGPRILASGHLGTFAREGHWSFRPPQGLSDVIPARIADFDRISDEEIRGGRNLLRTESGVFEIVAPCQYAILEPKQTARPIAWIGDDVVGIEAAAGRLKWYGVDLSGPFGGVAPDDFLLPTIESAQVRQPIGLTGDRVVAFQRGSAKEGALIFLLNVERRRASVSVRPSWSFCEARDLLYDRNLDVKDGAFNLDVPFGQVKVIHCL